MTGQFCVFHIFVPAQWDDCGMTDSALFLSSYRSANPLGPRCKPSPTYKKDPRKARTKEPGGKKNSKWSKTTSTTFLLATRRPKAIQNIHNAQKEILQRYTRQGPSVYSDPGPQKGPQKGQEPGIGEQDKVANGASPHLPLFFWPPGAPKRPQKHYQKAHHPRLMHIHRGKTLG